MSPTPQLVESYLQYCNIARACKENNELDLSELNWAYPTCLLPILGVLKPHKMNYMPPKNEHTAKYFSIMERNQKSPPKTAIPIVSLPIGNRDDKVANERIQLVTDEGVISGGKQATSYFIDELVNNIYDHSKFEHAFFMAQRYNKMKFTEMAFFDDGISIPGSYREYGLKFNDIEAIKAALDGVSSKAGMERGYGLCTSIRLLREGLKAEVLVVSKSAAFYFNENTIEAYDLQHRGVLDGTLICTRIPFTAQIIDVYKHIGGTD